MLDAVRTQMYQLRKAFAVATLARANLRLAETSEQQYAQTQALTQVKVDQGDIARVEIYRVTAGRLQYQQAVLQARTGYDAATRDVLNLLGAREQDIAPTIAQSGVSTFYSGSPASIGYSVPINRTGRYLRVQLSDQITAYLYMAEVQVWSQAASLGALARPAVPQSSSFDFRHAWRPPFAVVRGAAK